MNTDLKNMNSKSHLFQENVNYRYVDIWLNEVS